MVESDFQFSISAMFIMFRESLEAAIIVAVMLQLLEKMNMGGLKRYVWWGAAAGLVVSIIIGAIFVLCLNLLATEAVEGRAKNIFKGVIIWIAALLVTYVSFHFLKFYNLERKWKRKLEKGLAEEEEREALEEKEAAEAALAAESMEVEEGSSKPDTKKKTNFFSSLFSKNPTNKPKKKLKTKEEKQRWSMFFLAGSATLREGVESVIFLTATSEGMGVKNVILPAVIGIILGLICGIAVFWTGKGVKSLKWFFIFSCGFLLLVAAGMVVIGTTLFIYAFMFGPLWPPESRNWFVTILWDVSDCCNPNTNYGWQLLRTLFGWQAIVTNGMFLYYCLYWFLVVCMFAWKIYHGTLTDKREDELASLESMKRVAGDDNDNETTPRGSDKLSESSDDPKLDRDSSEGDIVQQKEEEEKKQDEPSNK